MSYRVINYVLAAIRDILLIIVMMLALAVGYRITVALSDLGDRLGQLPSTGVVLDQPPVEDPGE
jgi:hypothetical protein